MRRRIDKFVRDKLKDTHFEFEPSHWGEMSSILDKERKNRSIGPRYWLIAVFVLLSFTIFLVHSSSEETTEVKKAEIAEVAPELESLQNNTKIIRISTSDRGNLSTAKLSSNNTGEINSELTKSEASDQSEESLETLPINTTKVKGRGVERTQMNQADEIEKPETLASSDFNSEMAATDNLQLYTLQSPNTNNWGVGVGWHVENSWGWSTGAFASLDYRFHRAFSINVRPGLTFRSNKSDLDESINEVGFDPVPNSPKGDIEQLESYAVDIPLSLQIHKHRHLLSLGGGVHYAFLQKVSIRQNQLTGFNSFTNSNPVIFESTTDQNAWVQPTETFYPFAELYYSYLLTPSFELGGRSRFYMPEHLSMSNRLNFAAQLVWHIN